MANQNIAACTYPCEPCGSCNVVSSNSADPYLASHYTSAACTETADTICTPLKTSCFEQSFAEIKAALDALTDEARSTWDDKTWLVAGKGKTCKQDPANAASPANQVACENRFITSSAACVGTLGGGTCVWTVITPRTDSTLVGGSTSLVFRDDVPGSSTTGFEKLETGFSSCAYKTAADAVACNSAGTETECLAVKTAAGAGACTFQARQSSYSFLYFENVTATDTTDRQCQPKQICQTDEYESDPGTTTSDRTCLKLTVCDPALEYELHAPAVHPYVQLIHQRAMYTEDRQCQELSVCKCIEFEEKIGSCLALNFLPCRAATEEADVTDMAACQAVDDKASCESILTSSKIDGRSVLACRYVAETLQRDAGEEWLAEAEYMSAAADKVLCDASDSLNLDDSGAACEDVGTDGGATSVCYYRPSSKLVPLTVLRTSDRKCTALTQCADTQYESRYPTTAMLTLPASHAAAVDNRETTVPLYRSDRQCSDFSFGTSCTGGVCADRLACDPNSEYSSDESVACTLDPVAMATTAPLKTDPDYCFSSAKFPDYPPEIVAACTNDPGIDCLINALMAKCVGQSYAAVADIATSPGAFNFIGGPNDQLLAHDNWYPDANVKVLVSYPKDDAKNGCRDVEPPFQSASGSDCTWWAARDCNKNFTGTTAALNSATDINRPALTPRLACCACGGGSAAPLFGASGEAQFSVASLAGGDSLLPPASSSASRVLQQPRLEAGATYGDYLAAFSTSASLQALAGMEPVPVHQALLVTAFAKPQDAESLAEYPRTYGADSAVSGTDDYAFSFDDRGQTDPHPGFHVTAAVYKKHSDDWCQAQRVDTCAFNVYVFDDEPPFLRCPPELHVCTDGGADSASMYATLFTNVTHGLDSAAVRAKYSQYGTSLSKPFVCEACNSAAPGYQFGKYESIREDSLSGQGGFFPHVDDNVDGHAPGYGKSIVECTLDGNVGCEGSIQVETSSGYSKRTLTGAVQAWVQSAPCTDRTQLPVLPELCTASPNVAEILADDVSVRSKGVDGKILVPDANAISISNDNAYTATLFDDIIAACNSVSTAECKPPRNSGDSLAAHCAAFSAAAPCINSFVCVSNLLAPLAAEDLKCFADHTTESACRAATACKIDTCRFTGKGANFDNDNDPTNGAQAGPWRQWGSKDYSERQNYEACMSVTVEVNAQLKRPCYYQPRVDPKTAGSTGVQTKYTDFEGGTWDAEVAGTSRQCEDYDESRNTPFFSPSTGAYDIRNGLVAKDNLAAAAQTAQFGLRRSVHNRNLNNQYASIMYSENAGQLTATPFAGGAGINGNGVAFFAGATCDPSAAKPNVGFPWGAAADRTQDGDRKVINIGPTPFAGSAALCEDANQGYGGTYATARPTCAGEAVTPNKCDGVPTTLTQAECESTGACATATNAWHPFLNTEHGCDTAAGCEKTEAQCTVGTCVKTATTTRVPTAKTMDACTLEGGGHTWTAVGPATYAAGTVRPSPPQPAPGKPRAPPS
jgi:hypothetical protein